MTGSAVDRLSDRPLDELVQTVSEQAVVLARQQVDLARREMATKVRQAGAGAAMVGGAGALAALASGTGTAALVLLLARRPGASAAALGVAGAYAGAGALLAREGLERLRDVGPLVPEETVQNAKNNLGEARSLLASRASASRPRLDNRPGPRRSRRSGHLPLPNARHERRRRAPRVAQADQRRVVAGTTVPGSPRPWSVSDQTSRRQ
jgi:hypothetical protein